MSLLTYGREMALKVIGYKLARAGLIKPPMPLVITYSVTNLCQSRCKTCYIWKLWKHNPKLSKDELTLAEIEKIFKSMGHTYFFNISGGEPYLRKDLPQIIDLACKYLTPGVIHIPTNGLAPELIEKKTKEILKIMKKNKTKIPLTIKPSLDAVGKKHDKIRGVKGNFERVMETIKRLNKLKEQNKNLHVGVGTIISNFNVDDIQEIVDFAHKLDMDSYISEIAEQRTELFTMDKDITPSVQKYKKAINYFMKAVRENMKNKRPLTRYVQAFRLVYYNLVIRTLKEKRQIIPCYAGLSNFHLTPNGDVWPCCILGYAKPMGNLREYNYNFKKMWYSKKAREVRKYIKDGKCHCPFANQSYSNILINFRTMLRVVKNIVFI